MAGSHDICVRKSELLYQFGLLLETIENGILASEEGHPPSYSQVRAKYQHDFSQCERIYRVFFLEAIPGHRFSAEWNRWRGAARSFQIKLESNDEFSAEVKEALDKFKEDTFDIVCSIPNNLGEHIIGKHSPFSAFILLRSLFENARRRVEIIDPYLDDTVFYRYLNHVSPDVEVTLVTEMKNLKGNAEIAFLDCSRLFAQERGPNKYTLIDAEMHDRWMLADDEIYQSGASLKDAAKNDPFTLVQLQQTEEVSGKIDALRNSGSVKFGPSCTTHP